MTITTDTARESLRDPAGAPDPAAPPPDAPMLNVTEIQNAIRVIDHAAEQGAFKGWSVIEQVLLVRNRLNEFLRAVVPPEEGNDDAASAAASGEGEPPDPAAIPATPANPHGGLPGQGDQRGPAAIVGGAPRADMGASTSP